MAVAAAAVAAGAVPLAGAAAAQAAATPLGDLSSLVPGVASDLPLSSMALSGLDAPMAVDDNAVPTDQAALAPSPAQQVSAEAQQVANRLTSTLPVGNMVPGVLTADGAPLQVAPNLLHEGALGTLSGGLAPQAQDVTGAVVGQTAPLVGELHQAGVPTAGEMTGRLSQTALPGIGTVGSLTQSLPVTSVLGPNSPVTGALNNLSQL
jgi:hypothetical protein